MNLLRLAMPLAMAGVLPLYAQTTSISFDTSHASGWNVSGGGAHNVSPYVVPIQFYSGYGNYVGNIISVTSDGINTGTFLPGGSLGAFDGFWTATFNFILPANATNVKLDYSNFFVDDRAVLMLNGTIFDSTGLTPGPGQNSGTMVLTDGGAAQPYVFNEPFGQVSGTVNSGFNVGGLNTLTAIINNTGNGIAGTMNGNLAWNDGTGLGLTGTISYNVVPEPAATALVLLGIGLVSVRGLHRPRN